MIHPNALKLAAMTLAAKYQRQAKEGDNSEYLKGKLETFERLLKEYEKESHRLPELKNGYTDQVVLGSVVRGSFDIAARFNLRALFLEILSHYELNAKDRKVIENASKFFDKKTMRRIDPEKAVEVFTKHFDSYKLFYSVAKRILSGGRRDETSESVIKAGSFNVVNTGGFDDSVMENVAKLVEKAEQLLRKKGLGKVCYGNIQVSNKIDKSTRTLATYHPSRDSIYVRANLKGKSGPAIESILHELGHRLSERFLTSKKTEIKNVYKETQKKISDLIYDKEAWPEVGSEFEENGNTYVVEGVTYKKYTPYLMVHNKLDPNRKGSLPMDQAILYGKTKKKSPFISTYAATNPEENFAEMIAHYCLESLPQDQVEILESRLL